MPTSKLALLRFQLIDRMIRNKYKPFPTKAEILDAAAEKFGVRSPSTIEKDLQNMRLDFDAPIEFSRKHRGYYYSDHTYQFMQLKVNLSEENLMALQFVEGFLEEFKALPIFNQFSDAVDKVLDGLEITRAFNRDTRPVNSFIQLDKSQYVKGSEKLSGLIRLIADRKPITLHYQKFNSTQSKSYLLHPYLLREFKNLWYVVGFVEQYEEVRIFAVDRITHYEEEKDLAYKPEEEASFNKERFFLNCYGVTALNEPPQDIILLFTASQGNYIKANPIHHSQQIIADTDQHLKIRLNLIDNFELRSLLLSYGDQVHVKQPDSLREALQEIYQNAAKGK